MRGAVSAVFPFFPPSLEKDFCSGSFLALLEKRSFPFFFESVTMLTPQRISRRRGEAREKASGARGAPEREWHRHSQEGKEERGFTPWSPLLCGATLSRLKRERAFPTIGEGGLRSLSWTPHPASSKEGGKFEEERRRENRVFI
jgi:hypothetical protein